MRSGDLARICGGSTPSRGGSITGSSSNSNGISGSNINGNSTNILEILLRIHFLSIFRHLYVILPTCTFTFQSVRHSTVP